MKLTLLYIVYSFIYIYKYQINSNSVCFHIRSFRKLDSFNLNGILRGFSEVFLCVWGGGIFGGFSGVSETRQPTRWPDTPNE